MFWFSKLKKGLKKTSDSFREIFISKDMKEALALLEEKLILCDMGISTAEEIVKTLKEQNIKDGAFLKEELKKILIEKLTGAEGKISLEGETPKIFLFFGVNGSGKTTTIGKLAEKIKNQKKKVLLIAADTFRAAAIEQLDVWSKRAGVDIFSKPIGSDPSSVIFEGLQKAQKEKFDVVLIDSSGRLPNKTDLMAELQKMVRVIKKFDETAPHESLLVLDATIGQNSLRQVELFSKAVPLSGFVITKLDGSAKGGMLIPVFLSAHLPIYFIGVGEKTEDLDVFSKEEYVKGLLE